MSGSSGWEAFFAWHPVRIGPWHWAWLRHVERREVQANRTWHDWPEVLVEYREEVR